MNASPLISYQTSDEAFGKLRRRLALGFFILALAALLMTTQYATHLLAGMSGHFSDWTRWWVLRFAEWADNSLTWALYAGELVGYWILTTAKTETINISRPVKKALRILLVLNLLTYAAIVFGTSYLIQNELDSWLLSLHGYTLLQSLILVGFMVVAANTFFKALNWRAMVFEWEMMGVMRALIVIVMTLLDVLYYLSYTERLSYQQAKIAVQLVTLNHVVGFGLFTWMAAFFCRAWWRIRRL